MIKTQILPLLFLGLAAPAFAQAEPEFSPHSMGLTLGGGSAKYKGSSEDGNGVGNLYLYYHYSFTSQFGLEVGINGGTEASDWECKKRDRDNYECRNDRKPIFGINADELDYTNLVVAATANYPLSERNSLYGKAGAQFFDYEISQQNAKLADDSGVGLYLEGGWQYRWDNGIGMNVGVKYLTMSDLKVTGMDVGISYRF
ncbi:porin family protein [Bowmanella denitrificans]|uniref:porin family protein n=1 Tax=Bowmanella denitrificans TaxID=366582 RepID=UPI000C9AAF8A|nr:porin family protein [Bowmanella denitrificans]